MTIGELIEKLRGIQEDLGPNVEVEVPDRGCGCCGYGATEVVRIVSVTYTNGYRSVFLSDRNDTQDSFFEGYGKVDQ